METVVIAEVPAELATHWQHVLADAGIECELELSGEVARVRVPAAAEAEARALFEDPFGEEDTAPPGTEDAGS